MYVVIVYDISTETAEGKRRLRTVAKTCENYGMRIQDSVFECDLTPGDYELVKSELYSTISDDEDRITCYNLGSGWQRKIERLGQPPEQSFSDDFVV